MWRAKSRGMESEARVSGMNGKIRFSDRSVRMWRKSRSSGRRSRQRLAAAVVMSDDEDLYVPTDTDDEE
jgi:hypothetical protein